MMMLEKVEALICKSFNKKTLIFVKLKHPIEGFVLRLRRSEWFK